MSIRYVEGYLDKDFKESDDGGLVLKKGAKKTVQKHLEILPCKHMNNLKLKGNKSGVCPVCDKLPEEEEPTT